MIYWRSMDDSTPRRSMKWLAPLGLLGCIVLAPSVAAAALVSVAAPANLGGDAQGKYIDASTGKSYDGTGFVVVDIDGAFHIEHPVFKSFAGRSKIYQEACIGQRTGTPFPGLCNTTNFVASNSPGRTNTGYYYSGLTGISKPGDSPYNACRAPNLLGVVTYCHDYHGTATAALMVGQPTAYWPDSKTQWTYSGVAPGAQIITIKIGGGSDASSMGFPIDSVTDALSYVNRALMDNPYQGPKIAAVNLSISGGLAGLNDCKPGSEGARINDLVNQIRSKGAAVVMAAGNSGGAVGSWACGSQVIAAGATGVQQPTVPTAYSNISRQVALFAPVGNGDFAKPEDLLLTAYADAGAMPVWGTSFASPQIAAAFAVLRQKYPNASVDMLTALLMATGKPISGPRAPAAAPGAVTIDIGAALSVKAPF